jgi:hypothetical protein
MSDLKVRPLDITQQARHAVPLRELSGIAGAKDRQWSEITGRRVLYDGADYLEMGARAGAGSGLAGRSHFTFQTSRMRTMRASVLVRP